MAEGHDWTSQALSGWCMMHLHGWADEEDRVEPGYCRLDSNKCGCGCHTGMPVTERRTAWSPQADEIDGQGPVEDHEEEP